VVCDELYEQFVVTVDPCRRLDEWSGQNRVASVRFIARLGRSSKSTSLRFMLVTRLPRSAPIPSRIAAASVPSRIPTATIAPDAS
jgi:hypothetical protein